MKKFATALPLLCLIAIGNNSCTTDFEVNAGWKEIGIAYMLLDKNDSVQYLKLNKAYLNTDADANEIAMFEDSIYFDDADMDIQLIAGVDPVKLYRVRLEDGKDDGVFANPGQYVYRTPPGYEIIESRPYKLQIENTRTGYMMTSEVRIVKDGTINSPNPNRGNVSFAGCNHENGLEFYVDREMELISGKASKFFDFDIVFNYAEVNRKTFDTTFHELSWPISKGLKSTTNSGGAKVEAWVRGDEFFDFIALRLDELESADMVRLPGKVEFRFHAGGQELYDYINVNTPSIGIVQKKPEYTNLENGYGIFSSRTSQTVSISLDRCTRIQLSQGEKTGHLGFVR